jgi:hypothetical protein
MIDASKFYFYLLFHWRLCCLKIALQLNYHICCFDFILVSYVESYILLITRKLCGI